MRKTIFANEEYYHICNRGVDKRTIFEDRNDYARFLVYMDLVNDENNGNMENWRNFLRVNPRAKLSDFRELSSGKVVRLVEYSAYCLNPNHYHIILKQLEEKGIATFMHKLSTGYTNYFNKKYERSGSLFQGSFKSIYIDSNEQLLYVSVYVNKNHFVHGYEEGDNWEFSSLNDYLGKRNGKLCNKDIVLNQFKSVGEYEEFMNKNSVYMKNKKIAGDYMLE